MLAVWPLHLGELAASCASAICWIQLAAEVSRLQVEGGGLVVTDCTKLHSRRC